MSTEVTSTVVGIGTVSPRREGALRRLLRDKVAVAAGLVLAFIVVAAACAPWVAPYDPYRIDLTRVMLPPDGVHWLGTDTNGRDILSRLIFGARNTLLVGMIGVTVGGLLGAMTGIVAAFYRSLGHSKLDTTALYARVATKTIRSVTSPLERLALLMQGKDPCG